MLVALFVALAAPACGGGAGGGEGTQDLVLLQFLQADQDTIALNTTLQFRFNVPVLASSCNTATFQIREGDSFGDPVAGEFRVDGATVYFDPQLPSFCDLRDGGLQPDTTYRISLLGEPEFFTIKSQAGKSLGFTMTLTFSTRAETDPDLFTDQVPGVPPVIVSTSPGDHAAAVPVVNGNAVMLEISENLDPCSLTEDSIILYQYEVGDPGVFQAGAASGRSSGFIPVEDQLLADPTTWGGNGTPVLPPQRIPADVRVEQSISNTFIILEPKFGRFPENSLLAVQLANGVRDFAGEALPAGTVVSFTTENQDTPQSTYIVENEGETPYLLGLSSADVNTVRAPGKAQGFVQIAGDGDNGPIPQNYSSPQLSPDCTTFPQMNDGILDDLVVAGSVTFQTGATVNACPNAVDGSTAVVWEFSSLTIQTGGQIQIVGVNPAIILVAGPVTIETGGSLSANGEAGSTGVSTTTGGGAFPNGADGGQGIAGGGDGGGSTMPPSSQPDPTTYFGDDGWDGIGSPDWGSQGIGGGEGNVAVTYQNFTLPSSCAAAGGGAGHGGPGGLGGTNIDTTNNAWLATPRGAGGEAYPVGFDALQLLEPSAGSGGGAGGYCDFLGYSSRPGTTASGGGGGGGGGFVDITSSGLISIQGTISARGGRGGDGGVSYYVDVGDAAGGGGGSGGAIRLISSHQIEIGGATLTTQGGAGGTGFTSNYYGGSAPNHGGSGAAGRIVLEDSDGVIVGQGSATLVPDEGEPGFYRGVFDPDRFVGGGGRSVAVSDLFLAGALNPQFTSPLPGDFLVGAPSDTAGGIGVPAILVEIQGYQMLPDGSPDMGSGTGWHTAGWFADSGDATQPNWFATQIDGAFRPADNVSPAGIATVNGREYLQIRLSFYIWSFADVASPGPFLDRWTIKFTHNQ